MIRRLVGGRGAGLMTWMMVPFVWLTMYNSPLASVPKALMFPRRATSPSSNVWSVLSAAVASPVDGSMMSRPHVALNVVSEEVAAPIRGQCCAAIHESAGDRLSNRVAIFVDRVNQI